MCQTFLPIVYWARCHQIPDDQKYNTFSFVINIYYVYVHSYSNLCRGKRMLGGITYKKLLFTQYRNLLRCDPELHKLLYNKMALHCNYYYIIMTVLHRIAWDSIVLHYIALKNISLCCIALHCVVLDSITLDWIACMASHCFALCCVTLHYVTLRCVALRCIALHCVVLSFTVFHHCIALCSRDLISGWPHPIARLHAHSDSIFIQIYTATVGWNCRKCNDLLMMSAVMVR